MVANDRKNTWLHATKMKGERNKKEIKYTIKYVDLKQKAKGCDEATNILFGFITRILTCVYKFLIK